MFLIKPLPLTWTKFIAVKISQIIYFVFVILLSSCYTRVKPPVDYTEFRKSQKITLKLPEEIKRSKGFFVVFPQYVNQEPTDSVAIIYFNSQLMGQLRIFGYGEIILQNGTNDTVIPRVDSANTIISFNSISIFESKEKETVTEPTSKTEDYVNLKSITAQIHGVATTKKNVKEKYKSQNVFGQGTEKETYTGNWEYSRSLVDLAVGAEKSWRYRASVKSMPSDVIYTILDEMAQNTAKSIDQYIRFVNRN